ncbi:hypothetical protein [Ornithinibacillus caprae]|uniref:hypothetical protein n=1 Tax=Ornithinibacillus caprae TaxID=2678566 RepID=UPI0018C6580C|nr:hypothetical protein [Ornithinibacillus caprae]
MKIENPGFNYDEHGKKYSNYRQTDPRIERYVFDALGTAKTVLNVGAGADPMNHQIVMLLQLNPQVL